MSSFPAGSDSQDWLDASIFLGGVPTRVLNCRLYTPDGRYVYYTDGSCINNGGTADQSGCGVYAGDGLCLSCFNPGAVSFLMFLSICVLINVVRAVVRAAPIIRQSCMRY